MNIKHVKSPCCGAKIRHFGGRRRQCSNCKKTWRIRIKKRGRPIRRLASKPLQKVFLHNFSVKQLFNGKTRVKLPAYRYRFRLLLKKFIAQPHNPNIPDGILVLLADGVWFRFDGKPWVLYLTALKSCSGTRAVFLKPVLLQGKESGSNWQKVIAQIPGDIRHRICSLVVDNINGMQLIARENNWLLQLCHFHMLVKLKVRRDIKQRELKGGTCRIEIFNLVSCALRTTDPRRLNLVMKQLELFSIGDMATKRIRATIRGFLNCTGFYRTFLDYPNLKLPTTTNTMESMAGILRTMLRHSRAGSNPESLLLWAEGLIRTKRSLVCND